MLSDVCLSRTSGIIWQQRSLGLGRPNWHTRDSDTTFKVKGQLAGAWEYCGGLAYIVNIHGGHSYWKQGALGAAGVRDGLQLGRSVRRTAGGGILCRHAHSLLIINARHKPVASPGFCIREAHVWRRNMTENNKCTPYHPRQHSTPEYALLCPRPDQAEALSDDARLTSDDVWRLSVAYIGPKSRTGKLKLAKR